jgi:hypothetical protein
MATPVKARPAGGRASKRDHSVAGAGVVRVTGEH